MTITVDIPTALRQHTAGTGRITCAAANLGELFSALDQKFPGLKPHLRYLGYVVRHKWFVFRAGLRTGAPLWRLVIHDWSKFTPAEWGPSDNCRLVVDAEL